MTRLLYVHNVPMPGPEANTVNVAKMCAAFAANGCEVTLAVAPGAPREALQAQVRERYGVDGFSVVALPARPTLAAMVGAALARRRRSDLVYTRTPHVALAACLAGVPTMLEVHTDLDAFSPLGRAAFFRVVRHPKLRALVAISSALRERLRERLASHIVPCIVAPDGADAHDPAPALHQDRPFAVGFVGRFYRGKGLELIAQLAPLCPWAEFHLVGGAPALAERLAPGLIRRNVLLHGEIAHADVPRFLDSCDALIAPYQHRVTVADGRTDAAPWMSPLKVFEYMAAGKPILASDLPVLREVLADGDTALLLPPDRPLAWAKALVALRDDQELRRRLGEHARATFAANYTWGRRAQRILQSGGLVAA